jgi:hypothetical protein
LHLEVSSHTSRKATANTVVTKECYDCVVGPTIAVNQYHFAYTLHRLYVKLFLYLTNRHYAMKTYWGGGDV